MPLPVPVWAQVVPGQYDTSALFNTVSNNGNFLTNPPIFQGYQSATQSIANNTLTTLTMDTTGVDSYGGHNNVTNNSRYTAVVAGYYFVIGAVGLGASGTGNRLIQINKNGSNINLGISVAMAPGAANGAVLQCAAIVLLAVGDYLELAAYQTSGGALTTSGTQTGMTVIFIHA